MLSTWMKSISIIHSSSYQYFLTHFQDPENRPTTAGELLSLVVPPDVLRGKDIRDMPMTRDEMDQLARNLFGER